MKLRAKMTCDFTFFSDSMNKDEILETISLLGGATAIIERVKAEGNSIYLDLEVIDEH